jgi:hypothetical protein
VDARPCDRRTFVVSARMVTNQISKRKSTTAELPMAGRSVPAMELKSFGGVLPVQLRRQGLVLLASWMASVTCLGVAAVSPLLAFLMSRSLISAAMTFCAASIPYVYNIESVTWDRSILESTSDSARSLSECWMRRPMKG